MNQEKQTAHFAAANTTKGFKNYFERIFSPNKLDKIFILKGGPGTGKSSFMRIISNHAQTLGYHVEEFFCSSDPRSLDGVIIQELNFAILDGTSPHTAEPTYPGVVESIIYTGAFWNHETLCKEKKRIISLIQEKKKHFKRAYQFLNAYGEIQQEIRRIGEDAVLTEKLNAFASRLSSRIPSSNKTNEEIVRIQSAIHAGGIQKLDTFERLSDRVYVIEDNLFSGYLLLQKLLLSAKMKGQQIIQSPSCIFPTETEALYLPEESTCFIMGERNYETEFPGKSYHYINMARFLDKEQIRLNRQKIRFGKRCAEMLLDGATDSFSEASSVHFKLENIYVKAMDFDKFSQMTEGFIQSQFSKKA